MSNPTPGDSGNPKDPSTYSQEVQHKNIGARVPEKVARGVFSNGVLVLQGQFEFILDFVLRVNQPHQVVARVALPIGLMPNMIGALQENLNNFQNRFGSPHPLPVPPQPPKPPSIEEIYDNLKLSDEVLSGVYANGVMIVHTPSEFCFEFITNYYPRAAISARVFLSAQQVPIMLKTLNQSWQNFQSKMQQPPPPPTQPGA